AGTEEAEQTDERARRDDADRQPELTGVVDAPAQDVTDRVMHLYGARVGAQPGRERFALGGLQEHVSHRAGHDQAEGEPVASELEPERAPGARDGAYGRVEG